MAEVAIASVSVNGDREVEEIEEIEECENVNGNTTDSKENFGIVANGVPSINERLKRRAKRPSKFLSKDLRTSSDTNVIAPLRALKNSRKSRNGFGRGLPKKGKLKQEEL